MNEKDLSGLDRLYATVAARKGSDPTSSYTAKLYSKGSAKIAQKVGEEAVELAIAAALEDRDEIISESADLLYHLSVLWANADVDPADIYAKLKAREGQSGLAEKAALLCRHDPLLRDALAGDLEEAAVSGHPPGDAGLTDATHFPAAAEQIAPLLARANGPRIAVIETGGWDIHSRQGGATGPLANRIAGLSLGLATLAELLGPHWQHTVVVVLSEYGRTLGLNSRGGTEHGLATGLLVLGGKVRGGLRAKGWSGLDKTVKLAGGKGLAPAVDSRAVLKSVLAHQLGLSRAVLDRQVFPGSGGIAPVEKLFS